MNGTITIPRDALAAFCRRHRIRKLSLFGSAARDQASVGSDVDLLVEFDRPVGLLHVIYAEQYLEEVLGVDRVDLVLRRAVLPELEAGIFAEAVDVFGMATIASTGN
jgi:hypothetical protein